MASKIENLERQTDACLITLQEMVHLIKSGFPDLTGDLGPARLTFQVRDASITRRNMTSNI